MTLQLFGDVTDKVDVSATHLQIPCASAGEMSSERLVTEEATAILLTECRIGHPFKKALERGDIITKPMLARARAARDAHFAYLFGNKCLTPAQIVAAHGGSKNRVYAVKRIWDGKGGDLCVTQDIVEQLRITLREQVVGKLTLGASIADVAAEHEVSIKTVYFFRREYGLVESRVLSSSPVMAMCYGEAVPSECPRCNSLLLDHYGETSCPLCGWVYYESVGTVVASV